ncbi:MAG: response regulator transcription factor [Deltaproteobacteria bacterium]|nr:response regulator transcription factor [Myxococcales bacterium]MDP3216785.1 response regulator transcription factor [Deltaproteobacteria bacterium]
MTIRVLHIDDDARFAELVASYLSQNGMVVSHAPDGGRGLAMLERADIDAVLLDVMMPGIDGLEVCRRIRAKRNVPIVMLTAKGDETDRIVGLELGADDYLPKPCSPRELLARLRAVLRRAQPEALADRLVAGRISIDVPGREVKVDERRVELTGLEFDLLVALARKAGRVVSRESLLAGAGRDDVNIGERAVDVHVSHLRQKLGDDPRSPTMIRTIRGVGYALLREGDA